MPKLNVVDGVAWVGLRTATPGECAERIADLEAALRVTYSTIVDPEGMSDAEQLDLIKERVGRVFGLSD